MDISINALAFLEGLIEKAIDPNYTEYAAFKEMMRKKFEKARLQESIAQTVEKTVEELTEDVIKDIDIDISI